ncbi:MAG: hypothetical protein ACI943_002346, partial [Gammaproteobacteria bacterium]
QILSQNKSLVRSISLNFHCLESITHNTKIEQQGLFDHNFPSPNHFS